MVNHSERFERVVISNTGSIQSLSLTGLLQRLKTFGPTNHPQSTANAEGGGMGDSHPAKKFAYWQKWCWETPDLPIGMLMPNDAQPPSIPMQLIKFLLNCEGVIALADGYKKSLRGPVPGPQL